MKRATPSTTVAADPPLDFAASTRRQQKVNMLTRPHDLVTYCAANKVAPGVAKLELLQQLCQPT